MNIRAEPIDVTFRVNLRPHQLAAHRAETRFDVLVWHRRAGKTYYVISKKIARALRTSKPDYRAFYLAPTRVQAKAIAWDYVKRFTLGIPGAAHNEAELRVDFMNGARIQLLGAEHYDALRGRYADDVTLDETALIPGAAWTQVLSPMLADRMGRATFIGTPAGRVNLFFELFEQAGGGDDPEWSRSLLTHADTNVIAPAELKRLRRTMREEEFAQEMECSWNAALRGAYYAREIERAESEGRITTVRHERALPVNVAVDLGWSDAMVAIFHQQAGTEHRILMAKAYEETSIPDMIEDWRSLPFRVNEAILPHDAKVTELGSGRTRKEIFESLGVVTTLAPNLRIHEGIAQVREILANAWFDREGCRTLLEALLAYRSEFDEVRNVHRMTPVHDWSSHWADAMRYLAVGRPSGGAAWGDNSGLYDELDRGVI